MESSAVCVISEVSNFSAHGVKTTFCGVGVGVGVGVGLGEFSFFAHLKTFPFLRHMVFPLTLFKSDFEQGFFVNLYSCFFMDSYSWTDSSLTNAIC